jgi:hypothetical protein
MEQTSEPRAGTIRTETFWLLAPLATASRCSSPSSSWRGFAAHVPIPFIYHMGGPMNPVGLCCLYELIGGLGVSYFTSIIALRYHIPLLCEPSAMHQVIWRAVSPHRVAYPGHALSNRPDCKRQACRRHILAGSGIESTDQ